MTEVIEVGERLLSNTTMLADPALRQLGRAKGIASDRAKDFDRHNLSDHQKAEYIDSVAEELKTRANSMRYQIYEIGRLLMDVKSLLPHGEFDNWLKENTPFSKTTALNCMRVYKVCLGQPEVVEHFSPSALYVICAPGFSRSLRAALFNTAEEEGVVFDGPLGQLMQTAIKWKQGEVTLTSPEVQALMKGQKRMALHRQFEVEVMALITLMQEKLEKMRQFSAHYAHQPLLRNNDLHEEVDWYEQTKAVVDTCTHALYELLARFKVDSDDTEGTDYVAEAEGQEDLDRRHRMRRQRAAGM